MATVEEQYAQRQAETQKTYDARQAQDQALYDQRQAQAQATYDQRNAEALNTYNERLAESQGKINDLYGKAFEAQKQQLQTAQDKGIAAQEEARANVAKSYQTSANDLAVQYERNRRNLNAQALAHGLNTGAGAQQQLALNQGYMSSYGRLRGEESAQNAGIDRAIANLKADYQSSVAQALANNEYQKAAALLDDYNGKLSWLDSQKMANRDFFDSQSQNNQSRLDNMVLNNRSYLDTGAVNNRNWADAQNRIDVEQSREDAQRAEAYAREDKQNADKQALIKAETLASFGDFSGYAALYGQNTANLMKQMWISQNPQMAWQAGLIDDATYLRWLTGPQGEDTGGGGGGGWYGGSPSTGSKFGDPDEGKGSSGGGGGGSASGSVKAGASKASSLVGGGKGGLSQR